ncbi:putative DeoR family transcriptional regulator [Gordonia effusa NBRC 100432]|uniref:Putative DeoR family transcriptional regulator n=1 Tax=Gordonia effusa NBRC 100432 TaxID=1077974 RepID=H0R1E5_9ACTN|nr:WYL domain-containing protein [Gordonia effusa]GAB18896.1 putative DeoR family transcriptional regulator [Gordonia effusa NBRC 100432]
MADTTTRTLKLLALLQAHRLWAATELADRLDTTERTVRRDVERLRELGYPVESVRGSGGGYQLAPGGSMPPLVVDEEEAVAIVAALRGAASGSAAGLAEASVRALAKVTQVLPPKLRKRADALRAMSVVMPGDTAPSLDAEALTTVALACRDAVELEFEYVSPARGGAATNGARSERVELTHRRRERSERVELTHRRRERSERVELTHRRRERSERVELTHRRVEPLRLVPMGRRWYLLAYDLDRLDWRTFRVDRLRNAKPGKRSFRPREVPGGDAGEYVRASLRSVWEAHQVRVLVQAPTDAVRERIGRWAQAEEQDGGTLVTMQVEDARWVAMAMGSLDADYEFVEIPPELLREIRGRNARESRALYLVDRGTS